MTIKDIFGIKKEVPITNFISPNKQSVEQTEDYSTKKVVQTKELEVTSVNNSLNTATFGGRVAAKDFVANYQQGYYSTYSTGAASQIIEIDTGDANTSVASTSNVNKFGFGLNGVQIGNAVGGFSVKNVATQEARIRVNSITSMFFDSAGKVGIGTTAPATKLEVRDGDILIKKETGYSNLYFNDNGAGSSRYSIVRKNYDSPYNMDIVASSDPAVKRTLNIYNSDTGTPTLIVDSTQSVGINCVPDEDLHVYGTTDTVIKIQSQGARSDNNTPSPRLYFNKDLTSGTVNVDDVAALILVNSDDASNNLGNSHQILFRTSGVTAGAVTTDMVFQTVQNTSIGTLAEVARFQGSKTLLSGTLRLKGYTVATLPAGVVGDCAYVTDALAPAWGVAVAGGGAVTIKVFYDGTNWIVG